MSKSIDIVDLSTRKRFVAPDGAVVLESQSSRVRRVAMAWEALPDDEEVTVDPFDANAPGCGL